MKRFLSILLVFALFAGCSKEDHLGTVNISFERIEDKPLNWVVEIFTVENTSVAIYSKTLSASCTTAQVQLLPGNYVIRPYTMHDYSLFTGVSFQLTAGKTINVWYNENRIGGIR
jgi:hypothetical protein